MTHMTDVRTGGFAIGSKIATKIADLRANLAKRHAQNRVYRITLAELESLSMRELNDLGLDRHNLRGIAAEAAYK